MKFEWSANDQGGFTAKIGDVSLHVVPERLAKGFTPKAARGTKWRAFVSHWSDVGEDELMQMADRIGVARKWIQRPPKASWVHFDISLGCKAKALAAGAVLTDKYGPVVHTTNLRRAHAWKNGDLAMILRCDTMLKNIERMREQCRYG